jgi:predicted GNAT superfamily acetyltransferase
MIALWLLTSSRVERRVSGAERGLEPADVSDDPQALGAAQTSHELVRPGDLVLDLDAPRVRVAIPADISNLMARSTDLAVAWREATRAALTHYLDRGYEAQELVRCGRTSEYLLSRKPV